MKKQILYKKVCAGVMAIVLAFMLMPLVALAYDETADFTEECGYYASECCTQDAVDFIVDFNAVVSPESYSYDNSYTEFSGARMICCCTCVWFGPPLDFGAGHLWTQRWYDGLVIWQCTRCGRID